jgi:hypothetical protein
MKYIIFRDKNFITMTAHESVKDKILTIEHNSWALPVSDEQYRDFGENNSWTLNADNSAIVINKFYQNQGTVIVSDPEEARQIFKNHINDLKTSCENSKKSNPGLESLISFLDTIDTSIVSSITNTNNLTHIIYSLPGCPQIYCYETYSVDFLS